MEEKEKPNPKEEAVKQIDHLLNDFWEFPEVWLTNEEKTAVPNPENKKSRFQEELDDLLKRVRSEGGGAISKDTIDKAEKLLKDVRLFLT